MIKSEPKAWVVAADMGLGHQRAAFPLSDMAEGEILTSGSRDVTSGQEYALWNRVRSLYDFLSKARRVPLIGRALYQLLHSVEDIPPFYPLRDLSSPTFQTRYVKRLIMKKGMGSALLAHMARKNLPLVTTFYVPALAADYRGYSAPIYCVICDTDINRAWVADDPAVSKIRYLAPCDRIVRRLQQYGVDKSNIHLTGFPLPKQNLGHPDKLSILKHDVAQRLANLDPEKKFFDLHHSHVKEVFGRSYPPSPDRQLSVTFAIGGAGAQTEIAIQLMESLRPRLLDETMTLYISAGISQDVARAMRQAVTSTGLDKVLDRRVHILNSPERSKYFEKFNDIMQVTDILWTKPSELSFYCGLGIPIIIAPPIGPHEYVNRQWILGSHGGVTQEDPRYALEWIEDLLKRGVLAEAAWDAYLKCPKKGTFEIESVVAAAS